MVTEQVEHADGRVELSENVVLNDPALFNEELAPTRVARREGSRSRVGCANDRPCKSTRYLFYEIALAPEPPTVVVTRAAPPS